MNMFNILLIKSLVDGNIVIIFSPVFSSFEFQNVNIFLVYLEELNKL